MAIWQFQLTVIPRKGIIEKLGKLPEKLFIDYKERTEHYHLKKEKLLEEQDDFKDALTRDWWSSTDLLPMEVIHQIDKKVRRAHYSKDTFIQWKYSFEKDDNDVLMLIGDESGKIEELTFRVDLREKDLKFLHEMIEMAEEYDWLLMDVKGNLVEPRFKEVAKLIRLSNSFKFSQDPLKFLTDIGKGKID